MNGATSSIFGAPLVRAAPQGGQSLHATVPTVPRSDTSWNAKSLRHSTSELRIMLGMALEHGIAAEQFLSGTSVSLHSVHQRQTRVSMEQQLEIHRRLDELSLNAAWPVVVANRLHLTSYGLAGYAMLSSETLSAALGVACLHKPLLNLKFDVQISVVGKQAKLAFAKGFALGPEHEARCTVLEIVKIVNLLRDLLGQSFQPTSVHFVEGYSDQILAGLVRSLQCPLLFGQDANEIYFESELLSRPLQQFDLLTHESCLQVCANSMMEVLRTDETTMRVKALIGESMACIPSMADIANRLCLSPRSLRRRLETEGTSYNEILDGIRRSMSERLLATTSMSIESIAEFLGYGDAANFRHAFKRWTGESPRQHRQDLQRKSGWRAGTSHARSTVSLGAANADAMMGVELV